MIDFDVRNNVVNRVAEILKTCDILKSSDIHEPHNKTIFNNIYVDTIAQTKSDINNDQTMKWDHNYPNPLIKPHFDKLPDVLHIGRKVKVIQGPHAGREGIVEEHWLNLDDCSGTYGKVLYSLQGKNADIGCFNNSCGIIASDCELEPENEQNKISSKNKFIINNIYVVEEPETIGGHPYFRIEMDIGASDTKAVSAAVPEILAKHKIFVTQITFLPEPITFETILTLESGIVEVIECEAPRTDRVLFSAVIAERHCT